MVHTIFLFRPMIKECVIASIPLDGSMFLIKNRDRNYIPQIALVHKLYGDVEVFFYKDLNTGWIEGINSYGIAIINSSLTVGYDEKEFHIAKKNKSKSDGEKILEALKQKTLKDACRVLWNKDYKLYGHTFINYGAKSYAVECTPNSKVFINRITDIRVETNHGKMTYKTGYIEGKSKISTHARQIIAKHELEKVDDAEDLLSAIGKNYINWDSQYQPYRITPQKVKGLNDAMWTTMQILFDTEDLYCEINYEEKSCLIKKKYISLPKGYEPKINFRINKIQTQ